MSNDCLKQLKTLKTDSRAGWVSSDAQKQARTLLMDAIKNQGTHAELMSASSGFAVWTFMNSVLRPIGASFAVLIIVAGGWFTTVRAATSSIPGDALYGLKLVAERAQLAVASLDERAVLHTEFAERRLREVAEMDVQSEYLEETLAAFRSEIKLAGQDLAQLQNTDDASVVLVASTIDQKITQLSNGINGSDNISPAEAEETKKTTQEVSNSAVEVLVEEHEVEESTDSALALSRSFKEQYIGLMERQTFDLGRIAVIENALFSGSVTFAVLGESQLNKLAFQVKDATDSVGKAMSLAGAGGYRAAFEIMKEADTQLLDIEAQLAQIEINITSELATPKIEVEIIEEISVTDLQPIQ